MNPIGRPAPLHTKEFAATPDQVRHARQFLSAILDGCPAAYEAALVLSELAANACLHSASPERSGTFTVTAHIREGSHVRIEVHDDGGPWN
jgi:anti-sigma regulatory factor (Ser/Thr protein kinase)